MSQQDYENGLKVRTEVMGESFVKRAQDNTVPFTQPLQDWINEHAWGSTWQREGVLPRKYRSLITIAFLTAQKSPTELKGHVRGALNNGATVEEIQEVLLHSLPYCGAPATRRGVPRCTGSDSGISKQSINRLSAIQKRLLQSYGAIHLVWLCSIFCLSQTISIKRLWSHSCQR